MEFRSATRRCGGNTDTMLGPRGFYKHNRNQEVAPRGLGRLDSFKNFLEYVTEVYGECLKTNIRELQDLPRRSRICHKDGPLGRISKFLM